MRKLVVWITTPSLLHGLALGIAACVLGAMAWQLALAQTVAAILIAAAFLLLLGVLLGHYFIRQHWRKLESESLQPLRETVSGLAAALLEPDTDTRRAKLAGLAPRLTAQFHQVGEVALGAALRFLAAGRLFALLGVTVSFAVFLATYMQVERLSEQNSLIRLQALSSHQQIALGVRSEIATVRSLEALATELLSIYRQQQAATKQASSPCQAAKEALDGVFPKLYGMLIRQSVELDCFRRIEALLSERASNLQANRLLKQQVTGSGLRINAFTRDLTEQFTTQFPLVCGTEAKLTSDMGRRWSALDEFEEALRDFLKAVDTPDKTKIVHLSGTPEQNALDSTRRFLALSGASAASVAELASAVFRVQQDTEAYLDAQRSACAARGNQLNATLERLDAQYERMLDFDKNPK